MPTESALPLAIFRILFCGLLLLLLLREFWLLFEFRELLFDAIPHRVPSRVPVETALLIWAIAVALILVGYKTRLAAVINYVFSVLRLGFAPARHPLQGHWDCFALFAASAAGVEPTPFRCGDDQARAHGRERLDRALALFIRRIGLGRPARQALRSI